MAQRLINQIPPHDVTISAFLGDCAVVRKMRPAELTIGIDLDRENVERWSRRRAALPGLRLYCCDGVAWLRHYFELDRVDLARPGPRKPAASAETRRIFAFLDPPYLNRVRKTPGRIYAQEMMEPAAHVRLLEVARRLPCQVMITHYPDPLYADALAGWRTFTFRSRTRRGWATEQVWCNYDEPAELHDSRYLGGDKRAREKYRRRARNLVAKLERMPLVERQAILDEVRGRFF